MRKHFADLRFKHSGFESMFPVWQKVVNEALDPTCIVASTEGVEVVDVDGQRFLDCSGSYGVNVFGHTQFKTFMEKGNQLAQQVGPCLGPMHTIVAENIRMLMQIFRKEEVSFHMSGTEAIMCAVQQVRFHTQRRLLVVFQGTYHGWWDGVMQGAGNENFSGDLLILKDMNPKSIELLKLRASEIAGVLVNPIMGVGWKNSSTSKLGHCKVDAGPAYVDKFRTWLKQIREACTQYDIPLIYDEVWAFQLGAGGAQDEYGVDADVVVLGKSLGGGHAVGAVLGSHRVMERRDPQRPMRVSFVVGTFKGSPMVMGSMNAVLKFVTSPEGKTAFNSLKDNVAHWVDTCNAALSKHECPISVAAYRNMWTICFHQPSLYQFLFQYYLRDAGIQMVWVGTGKMLFNLEFKDKDLQRLTEILISASKAFKADGWWYDGGKPPALVPPVKDLVLGPTLQYHCGNLPKYLTLKNFA
jgi:glutamate-1-semialdehyde 2,1-aminomutase